MVLCWKTLPVDSYALICSSYRHTPIHRRHRKINSNKHSCKTIRRIWRHGGIYTEHIYLRRMRVSESVGKRIKHKKTTKLLAEISFFSSFLNGTFAIGVFFFVSFRFVCLSASFFSSYYFTITLSLWLDVCVCVCRRLVRFFFVHHFLFDCCLRMHLPSRDGQIKDNTIIIMINNNCLFATKHVFSV